ncbi:MAG: heme lyase CcmF/NrfE family subunit [Deltaproteobacteria bacterium]|nr:heme lyase CcmF/NrfE family subunit [Deltaproteobacteria bacterium]MBI4223939.1 heme lyase CcmF/NrfE family subunit [Deltaproteobacteria bacterium]
MSWFGQACIFLCLGASLFGMAAACLRRLQIARGVVYLNFFLMTFANLGMIYALVTNDFSVSYVAQVGAKETPRIFAAVSLWSSLEGSILFWGWVLSVYSALCAYCYRGRFSEWMPWVLFTLLAIAAFFFLVLAFPANPFHLVSPAPENGPGPNPLLQNHWLMALHPPMLYLGYVGMSVPFAFAVASVVAGRLEQSWVAITRKWFLIAWMFLSTAIVLGAWWSYAVLGWGGYWAWDPVENASFMPWLTGTAFLHSIMVEERRGMLKIWNLGLIIITFLLTILGTFLTRSGVLDSVHSFTESEIGHYFLAAIVVALAVSAALLIWKADRLKSGGKLDSIWSRESAFLFNNLLFVCFCFVVLLGTLYPLIVEAVRGVKITVGEPFFNQMTTPLALLILLLMAVGVLLPWGKGDSKLLLKKTAVPLLLLPPVLAWAYHSGIQKPLVLAAVGAACFSFSIMKIEMVRVFLREKRLFSLNPRRYGGFVVHTGILLIVLGVAISKNYQEERQVTLKPGETFEMGSYQIKLGRLFGNPKPQRFEVIAFTALFKNGKPLKFLEPKLNFYPMNREPIGSPAVYSSWKEDFYLTLMAFEHKDFQATLRVMRTPAVSWIWTGGGIIILGVLIAIGMKKEETVA